MDKFKYVGRYVFELVGSLFDRLFGARNNPFNHLGALGWFFYWIVAVSGIYLYAFFDTGVQQAFESVEYMTHTQWYAGGIARSLHRYASDALIVVMLLHLLREFFMDRLRGPRWFAWVIGTAILWLVFASGITGYWIVWDKLAQYVAIATSEWLDTLPLFGQSIARNFLHDSTLSGRFFSLMVFIHIAVPLILLFVLWVHIQRISHADVNPPKGLAIGTMSMMLILSIAYPALSQGPADLSMITSTVAPDWFYMALYPVLDVFPGATVWAAVGLGTLLMLLLPWLPPKRTVAATVSLDNCNGCSRCADDCPFGAIEMRPRTDGGPHAREAYVMSSKCVGCGICVGACPTATPFRRRSALVSGIDLAQQPVKQLRDQLEMFKPSLTQRPRVIAFTCEFGCGEGELKGPGVEVVRLNCVGQLPPSVIDFILSRDHADGVFLTGCPEGRCHYRLGIRWAEQRLAGERDPYLRRRVPRARLATCWAGSVHGATARRELSEFLDRLRALEASKNTAREPARENGQ